MKIQNILLSASRKKQFITIKKQARFLFWLWRDEGRTGFLLLLQTYK